MKKSIRLFLRAVGIIAVLASVCCMMSSCSEQKKKSSKMPVDSSFDVIYTKSDTVKRAVSDKSYTIYGVTEQNADGTINLKKYTATSPDYGRTINILSNSGEDISSVKVDESTEFDLNKLKDSDNEGMTDLEIFMSKIGKKYNSKLIYFEMEITGSHADSVRFFTEYYR